MNLIKIQSELKAPKLQHNKFGNYKYRSQEDILEELKPLLLKYNCQLTLSDKLKTVNSVMFVEVTAKFKDGEIETIVKAQAGIEPQKGMTLAQCFGSSSSYARKYALNGLFLIDDTKDSDFTNNSVEATKTALKPISGSNPETDIKITDALVNEEQHRYKALFSSKRIKITK
jgi:hypothetical protein